MLVIFSELTFNDSILQWNVDAEQNNAILVLSKESESSIKEVLSHLSEQGITGISISGKTLRIDNFDDFCQTHTHEEIEEDKPLHSLTDSSKFFRSADEGEPHRSRGFRTHKKGVLPITKELKPPINKGKERDIIRRERTVSDLGKVSDYLSFDAILQKDESIWRKTGVYKEEMLQNQMLYIEKTIAFEVISPARLKTLMYGENMIALLVIRQKVAQSLETLMNRYICRACKDFSDDEMGMAAKIYQKQLINTSKLDYVDPPLAFASIADLSPAELLLILKIQTHLQKLSLLVGFQNEFKSLLKQTAEMHKINLDKEAREKIITDKWEDSNVEFNKYERLSTIVKGALRKKDDASEALNRIYEQLSDPKCPLNPKKINLGNRNSGEYFIKKGTLLHKKLKEEAPSKSKTANVVKIITQIIQEQSPPQTTPESSSSQSAGPTKGL